MSDLTRAMEFYEETLGLDRGYIDDRHIVFYFVSDDEDRSMLGLWETDEVSPRHFAFRVSDVDDMAAFLAEREIPVVESFDIAPEEQPLVQTWMPAAIYFEDPDGNSLELIADLSDEPQPDLGVVPLEEWRTISEAKAD